MMYLSLSLEQADRVAEGLRAVDGRASVRPHYSGRGMFGLECVGFVTQCAALVIPTLYSTLTAEGVRVDMVGLAFEQRVDALGLLYVVYFPCVRVREDSFAAAA